VLSFAVHATDTKRGLVSSRFLGASNDTCLLPPASCLLELRQVSIERQQVNFSHQSHEKDTASRQSEPLLIAKHDGVFQLCG